MNTRGITLKSVGFYLLRRIGFILLVTIICGAVFAGLKYRSDKKTAQQPPIKNDGSTLTFEERVDAEHAAMQFQAGKQAEKYLTESPLVRINAQKEVQHVVEYSFFMDLPDGEQSTGVKEETYLMMVRSYLLDGMYVPELIKLDSIYENNKYLKELVLNSSAAGGQFTMTVLESDMYPNLASDVRKVMEAYMDKLMKQEKGLKIQVVNESTFSFYDPNTDAVQRSAYSNLINYRKASLSAYLKLTPAQQAYFRKLTGYNSGEEQEYGQYLRTPGFYEVEADESAAPAEVKVQIDKMQVLIGCLAGFVGAIAICFLMLYLSLRNRSTLDYSENLGLRDLGLVTVGEKKHPFRNWLFRKEMKRQIFDSDDESVEYAAVRVGAYCRNHDIKELAVLSSVNSGLIEKTVENLKKALSKQGIKLHETEKVATDSAALNTLIDSKYSILVEQLYGGNRQKSSELLKFCKENDVEVIGALGVAGINR